ncbi:MAG: serine/threonine protein phosphatase [Hyphomonadaceae bacterium]|nr:MAG: metallophosphoesterase [Caulobacteraceae bacterium]MBT9446319.1 serine/threonine protein phosphatase [Hyphomonadaceae bacterium]TPW07995.1 MAG: metallophosphoesterase [Alphaproteobacteria bacterium]
MTAETIYYAIGDVHGMAKSLEALHALVLADHERRGGKAAVIHLGDYVDRGPDSRGVIDLVMKLEKKAEGSRTLSVHSLLGNHEQMMLDAWDGGPGTAEEHWLMNGGSDALKSYTRGRDVDKRAQNSKEWRAAVDPAHIDWLRELPTMLVDETRKLVFVHAGIDPNTYPDCKDEIRIWTRSPRFFDPDRWPDRPELDGIRVIHGHTPTTDLAPDVGERRINVDTGAVYGGALTCVVLAPGEKADFLAV